MAIEELMKQRKSGRSTCAATPLGHCLIVCSSPVAALLAGKGSLISIDATAVAAWQEAQRRRSSQGSDLPRVGGSLSAASSDGGAVPGSAASSAAPPTFSRQSPRALACVLRAPADDPAYRAECFV